VFFFNKNSIFPSCFFPVISKSFCYISYLNNEVSKKREMEIEKEKKHKTKKSRNHVSIAITDENTDAIKVEPNHDTHVVNVMKQEIVPPQHASTTLSAMDTVEERRLIPFFCTDHATMHPLAPVSIIVALDENHAMQLLDAKLQQNKLPTYNQKAYTIQRIDLTVPAAQILSFGDLYQ